MARRRDKRFCSKACQKRVARGAPAVSAPDPKPEPLPHGAIEAFMAVDCDALRALFGFHPWEESPCEVRETGEPPLSVRGRLAEIPWRRAQGLRQRLLAAAVARRRYRMRRGK